MTVEPKNSGQPASAGPAERWLHPDYSCSLPTSFSIDIFNGCNLRCPICPTGRGDRSTPRHRLSRDRFRILFDQIKPYARTIGLFRWGEPFLNPELVDIVTLISEHGIASTVDSNFNFPALDAAQARRIVQSGLMGLYASIDGTSQATYEQYRVGGNLALAMHNLRQIVQACREPGARTAVTWKFLVHRGNEHEIPQAAEMAHALGVPIAFQLLSLEGDPSWRSSLHVQAESLPASEELIVRVAEKPYRIIHQNYRPGKTGLHASQPALPQVSAQTDWPRSVDRLQLDERLPWCCRHPFTEAFIGADGAVRPCCTAYGQGLVLGNLFEQPFAEIWNGPELTRCRQYLLQYGSPQRADCVCAVQPCVLHDKATVA